MKKVKMPKAVQRKRRSRSLPESDSLPVISTSTQHSKTVSRALDILKCFPDGEVSLTLPEIGELARLPKASVFRILLTLEKHGYLRRNAEGRYSPARKLLFGNLYERAEKIREVVHPFLCQLIDQFDETTSLAVLFEDKIQIVDTAETLQKIGIWNAPGRLIPPYCSSLGKAITAFQPKDVIERIIRVYGLHARTEKTISSRWALLDEFDQIRRRGFAVDREESVVGVCCFGSPLYDCRQRVVAAISISCPVVRMTAEREDEMTQAIVDTSRRASRAMQSTL